ncbi:MAG: uncharacterized protein PWQ20_838 [Thermotogaceae bacterium]|nr:uncharacterized protein [Thermotogaceae bacterium]
MKGDDKLDFDDLYIMNPWWRSKNEIYNDRNINSYESSKFKYYPEKLFKEINLFEEGIYTLRGPRQIGKTTFLKLLIKKLIENNMNPLNLFFLSCDGIKDRYELIEIIKMYVRTFNTSRKEMKYIFLDEITVIEDWQHSIKFLVDIGLLDNSILILTGSSSYDLKSSSERLPGRKGCGKDLVYLPISFREFLKNLGISIEGKDVLEILSMSENELKTLQFRYSFIQEYFLKYVNCGGFPKVIDEFLNNGTISELTKKTYKDFILGDAEKYMKSRTNIIEILKKLPDIIGQRFSWHSLKEHLSGTIESVDTIKKYFEYLGYSFILSTVFFIDISKKTIKPKKQKKVYPIDNIVNLIISDTTGRDIKMPQRIEILTLNHILENDDVVDNGLNLYNGPFYWYSDRGNEIDFVMDYKGELIPIEVKYQNNINKFDYIGMKKVFRKGILITKNSTFIDENIVGIPAWLFLAIKK